MESKEETYEVTIKKPSGRVYKYVYVRGHVLNKKRKPYEHHPDFRYIFKDSKPVLRKPSFRTLKKLCLQRDDYKCQICLHSFDTLDIHHKDGNGFGKTKAPDNSLENLVSLCPSCHMRKHYNVINKHEAICKLYKEGLTIYEIAARYGVTKQRIHQILKANKCTYHEIHK